MVDLAIELYLREAYGASKDGSRTGAERAHAADRARGGEAHEPGSVADPFQGFLDETLDRQSMGSSSLGRGARDVSWRSDERAESGAGRHVLERYAMRLGNKDYPFMKLILQEHIVPGEFYFTVDTHDQMDIRPDYPDYEDWMRLKRSNFRLKQRIERSWEEEGVPTLSSVRRCAEDSYPKQVGGERRGLVLVVDDEENEACMIGAVLEAQGFDVVRAGDGREALDRLRLLGERPILIVLDYEMPEMDGLTMIRELRRHEDTRHLRVLLTTASEVISSEREEADAFLPKPFHSRDFLELVDAILDEEQRT